MPKKLNIKGVIIPNDYKWIYDWFEIDSTCPNDVNAQLEEANGEDIEVIINSGGGDVPSGSEIYTSLKDYSGNSIGKIVGWAASAASVAAMGVKKLLISPTAQIMMHNVSSYASGDYRDLQHESDVLKNYNTSIANAYILKSGMSQEELLELMNQETWLNAQQALEKKLVDEIMFDEGNQLKIVASSRDSQLIPIEIINKVKNELLKNGVNKSSLVNPIVTNQDDNLNNEEEGIMNLEELKEKHPDLYNQLINKGREEGIKAENERIKAIEDLGVLGFENLVNKAKFENKDTAEKLAMDIIKAQKNIGKDYLKNLKDDAKDLDDVEGSEAPENEKKEAKVKEGATLIANFANKKRGGTK